MSACESSNGTVVRHRRPAAWSLVALGSLLLAAPPAGSQIISNAEENRLFAGCVLGSDVVADIEAAIEAADSDITADVDFIVVYAIDKDDNGQVLDGGEGGTTGPVLCRSVNNTAIIETSEDADLFGVDILDADEALILRYNFGPETDAADRFCHTADGNVDCVDICQNDFDCGLVE